MKTLLTLAALLAVLTCGCGALVRPATRASVDEALNTLATPESGEDVARILSDPAIRGAARDLTRALVGAAADELTEEERLQQIEAAVGDFAERMSEMLGRQIRATSLALFARFEGLTREAAHELTTAETQEAIDGHVARLTRTMVRAAVHGLEEDAPPAMARMADDPELRSAVHKLARVAAHGMVLGTDEGLEERARHHERGGRSFLASGLESAAERGRSASGQFTWLTYAGSAAAALVVLLLLWQLHRTRREAHRREAALAGLTKAIRRTQDRPWSSELREALREHFEDGEPGSEYLRDLLREQQGIRTGPQPPHPGHASRAPSPG